MPMNARTMSYLRLALTIVLALGTVDPAHAVCGNGSIDGCPVCGDGVCEGDENEFNCPGGAGGDCGAVCACPVPPCDGQCGNGVCELTACPGESHESCPADCEPVGCSEQCDDGNVEPGDCCSATCQFEPAGSECRASAGACDPAEVCTGAAATCPGDAKSTAECRPSQGPCDLPENCDGVADECPVDEKSTDLCRASAGVCDVAESCDGAGNDCPSDQKSTETCRPAAGECDVAESCDGVGNDCPADGFVPAGLSCTDDGNACTDDACDGAGTCAHPNNSDPCDDGQFCTATDVCTGGVCSGSGDPCAGGPECRDSCNESTGDCLSPAGSPCADDGVVCTTDQCNGAGACSHTDVPFPCDHVLLVSWDGVRRDFLNDLLDWQGGPECPSWRHPPRAPVQCGARLTCLPNLCRMQVIDSRIGPGKSLTRPQHAQILSGYSPATTGIFKNSGAARMPAGYTIYERMAPVRGPELRTVQIAGRKYVSRGIVRHAAKSGALDVVEKRGGRDQYTGERTTEKVIPHIQAINGAPFFFFIHYKTADTVAHLGGAEKIGYLEAIIQNDIQLGVLLQAFEDEGIDDLAVIVTTDHGFKGKHHASRFVVSIQETWLAADGFLIPPGEASVLDVAPTILELLRVPLDDIDPPLEGTSLLIP